MVEISNNDDSILIEKLEDLRQKAYCPIEEFANYEKYKEGDFSQNLNRYQNTNNVINQIIEAKKTFILDGKISTTVVPRTADFADLDAIKKQNRIADIQDACTRHVRYINNISQLDESLIEDGLVDGVGFMELLWDADMSDSLGDIRYKIHDPKCIKWDKSAKQLKDCNYIFIEESESPMTLKKKYAVNENGEIDIEKIEKIDSLQKRSQSKEQKSVDYSKDIVSMKNKNNVVQAYSGDRKWVGADEDTIIVYTAYLKDDTIWFPSEKDTNKEEEFKDKQRFKYVYGRMIKYAGTKKNYFKFSDDEIIYRFGYPIREFTPHKKRRIQGESEVKNLTFIQDRINRAHEKIQELVANNQSTIVYDDNMFDDLTGNFPNAPALKLNNIAQYGVPQVIANQNLQSIQFLREFISWLREEMYKIARFNESMVSGQRPSGVNSGKMVDALNESPQTSIREIQRHFYDFKKEINDMTIEMIQIHYNMERYMRLEATKYAKLPLLADENNQKLNPNAQDSGSQIQIIELKGLEESIEEFEGDLSIGEYETEVIAGSEAPRTRVENSQLTTQLFTQGILSNSNQDLDALEIYLRDIDYHNYRAIITNLKAKQEEQKKNQAPTPPPFDKIGLNYKDLSPEVRANIINQSFGLQLKPSQTLTPDEGQKDMQVEQELRTQEQQQAIQEQQAQQMQAIQGQQVPQQIPQAIPQ